MATLKDFIKSNENSNFLPSIKEQQLAISAKLTGSLSIAQSNEFSTELVKLVNEDAFITELSDNIGKPKDNESEDEFVNRSRRILSDLLDKRLSK